MGALETSILYLVLGAVVAGAMWLQQRGGSSVAPWNVALWVLCWPMFAPVLLGSDASAAIPAAPAHAAASWQKRIAAAEKLLEDKLATLEGPAATLCDESGRIRQLQRALAAMAARLAEMDAVLSTPEFDESLARERLERRTAVALGPDDPALESLSARLGNIQQLKALRQRHLVELERALYRIEEMSSRLALLRFSDGERRDADALIDEISGTIDDITEAILAVA